MLLRNGVCMITIIGAGSTTAASLIPILLQETDAPIQLVSSRPLAYEDGRITQSTIDVRDKNVLKETIMKSQPEVIINLAAMTNVDKCESDKQMCWEVNVTLVESLARLARIVDARMVHVSTDYVFDGQKGPYAEAAVPNPIGYYGKSKLAGENACIVGSMQAAVVRTNVVYGPFVERPDFVRWVLDALESRTPIRVVNDQCSNPTYVDDISESILRIIQKRRSGIYHVGGADYCSRYEFALRIAEFFRADPSNISPVTTAELKQPARRPLKCGLITLKAEADLGMKMRGIESGLSTIRHLMFAK